ncbi:ClpP/crotonase-like domain-containing protein [Aspergillus californicus]
MLLRHSFPRSPTPSSWLSRISPATMPLRAKVTNPAFETSKMSFSSSAARASDPDDVLFNSLYGVRLVELNRPKKLNSLNNSMVQKIVPRLQEWEKSQLANIVMVSGAGTKALCAGGDVAALAKANQRGEEGQQASTDFFAAEYKLDHLIATYSKPFISVMDGITMGGGVGLSVHAPFRIATERTVFAMPETTIGFFPDVGGSFFLPRLDGEIGTYLAMTSERLTGVQALYAGIATHYFDSSTLSKLTARLSELVFDDHATMENRLDIINRTMTEFSTGLPSIQEEPIQLGGSLRKAIDRCFGHQTVEEILQALEWEPEHKEWAQNTLATISKRSPTSLRVTLRQMRLGKQWSIAEAFRREHQIASRFMRHPDFVEGVTARLVEKPARQANWTPATLAEVSIRDVDRFFSIPEGKKRMPLLTQMDFKEYPYQYALPSEEEMKAFAVDKLEEQSQQKIIDDFVAKHNYKEGLREKMTEVLARKVEKTDTGLKWE